MNLCGCVLCLCRFTFEIAPVFILMEETILRKMQEKVGWADEGDGIFCPGVCNHALPIRPNHQRTYTHRALLLGRPVHQLVHANIWSANHVAATKCIKAYGHGLEQGCQTQFPGGRSVCRFLWFPFNQLSIKACKPRCVYSLANQLLDFTKGVENNPKTSRHSGPPGQEFDTCGLEVRLFFRLNGRTGKKCDWRDFDCGMIVGAKRGGLIIIETADLLGFSCTTVYSFFIFTLSLTHTSTHIQ